MSLSFGFKNFYRKKLEFLNKWKNGELYKSILAGGLAGSSCLFFVYPLELVRTRLGVDIGQNQKKLYNGLFDCFSKIYK